MKLIKPLLIYITWIAFVWLCVGFFMGDYGRTTDADTTVYPFLTIYLAFILPAIYYKIKEIYEKDNP